MESNSQSHAEAWEFYIEQARNIMEEPDIVHMGNYRIPIPNMSGDFIYADSPEILWKKFIISWYKTDINSSSVYGKIQYIVETF
jgi:hypothetical protein